jgi:hypothetical protein
MGVFRAFGMVCAFLPVLAASAGKAVSVPTGQGDAASCAALAGRTVAADTVIGSAQFLPRAAWWAPPRSPSPSAA